MRVLLVNTNTCRVPYPVAPLGACLLASALRDEFEVRVHDGTFRGAEGLAATVRDFAPDVVGLSVRNVDDMLPRDGAWFLDAVQKEFLEPLRGLTRATLVVGGSAFSLFPRHLMDAWAPDYGIVAEGESSFRDLLRAQRDGGDASGIPGLAFRRGGEVVVNPPRCSSGTLVLPRADVDRWIDFEPYRRLGAYPVQARRGCTHGCIYCTYPNVEGRAYRLRDPEDIADEVAEAAARLPGVTFEFVDSTFNDPPGHAEAICRALARKAPGLRLRTMGVNPGNVTAELLDLMQAAGFAQIDCTPDSASPRMIKAMGKNFRFEELVAAARHIRARRMPTVWFFLFGGPGESTETLRESFDFIDREIDPEDLVLMGVGLRVYPGTPLHRKALRDGVIRADDDLVRPTFYVSPELGYDGVLAHLQAAAATRPNCLPPGENTPSPDMMREALEMRQRQGLAEPMFRTLLRIRRAWPRFAPAERAAP